MIIRYAPEFEAYFEALNRERIERYFSVEPEDERYSADPEGMIIEPGGAIFFYLVDGTPVGTAAAVRHDAASFELAKMGVTPSFQGRGVGRALAETVIEFAAAKGAERVFLISNSQLTAALGLYERLGFRHAESPAPTGYVRGDVYMVLDARNRGLAPRG